MKILAGQWLFWALGSAWFAALTAVFGKIGVEEINSNFATLIRTVIILVILGLIVLATASWQPLSTVSRKTWLFLILSGIATGLSWLCYYRALKLGPASAVAPIDKLSVVLVALFGVTLLDEKLLARNWLGIVLMAAGAALVAVRA